MPRPTRPTERPEAETVLLAVTGLSPAIVTETLWALAHESPAILPHRCVFLTTGAGAKRLQESLFSPAFNGPTPWQALRSALNAPDDRLIAEPARVIAVPDRRTGATRPLDDIQTPDENTAAASFILEAVRSLVENPDTRLIASIAGGRKTMGALLHAALTLLGRESDRITHVLVSPPYDSLPGFFFPGQPGGAIQSPTGKTHPPKRAIIQLADLPFVPLRNRFADLREMPGSFAGLVRKYSRQIKADAARQADLVIDYRNRVLTVDGHPVKLAVRPLSCLHALLHAHLQGTPPDTQDQAADYWRHWLKSGHTGIPAGRLPTAKIDPDPDRCTPTTTDFRHDLGEVRTALRRAAAAWQLTPRTLTVPPFSLSLREI